MNVTTLSPTTIATAQSALSCRQRLCSNWREIVSIVALVVAICSVVAAIFIAASGWAVFASIAFTITSAFTWHMAHTYAEYTRLLTATKNLQTTHARLQKSEQDLQKALSTIQNEQEQMRRLIASLRQENTSMKQSNVTLQAINHQLAKENTEFVRAQQALTQEAGILKQQVQTFQSTARNLETQIHDLKRHKQQLEHQMRLLQEQGLPALEQTELETVRATAALQTGIRQAEVGIRHQRQVTQDVTMQLSAATAQLDRTVQALRAPTIKNTMEALRKQTEAQTAALNQKVQASANISKRMQELAVYLKHITDDDSL